MRKWIKFFAALFLLPVCGGAMAALWHVVRASGNADTVWVAALAGAGCWLAIYALLPKPMWVYVLGHELTHAVWVWMMGGRVKKLKVTSSGGHAIVSKTNFLIALAPYFFPLYAVLVVAAYGLGRWLGDWQRYAVWFHLLLGATYAFHITLTADVLRSRQTDVTEHGYLFSAVVIFLGNMTVLLIGIPLLTASVRVTEAFQWWGEAIVDICHWFR